MLKDYRFKTKPYDHQLESFLASRDKKYWGYFMEMGTGKSKVIIDRAAYQYLKGWIKTMIIVAPKGVYRNWPNKEIPAHIPDEVDYRIATYTSTPRAKDRAEMDRLYEPGEFLRILVMNVEAISRAKGKMFLKKFVSLMGPIYMVVDESTCIKNPRAKRTKNIIQAAHSNSVISRCVASGEPVTRDPMDLFSQCMFLHEDLIGLGSYYAYRGRYAKTRRVTMGNRTFQQVVGFQNLDELQGKLTTFTSRVKKEDCLDLPPKIYLTREIELTPDQEKMYKQIKDEALVMLEEDSISTPMVLTQLLRLQQIVCGFVKTDTGEIIDLKENRTAEMIEVIEDAGDKLIIWCPFVRPIERIIDQLRKEYGDASVVHYYGATSDSERERAVNEFQDGSARFFVGNPQTGGFGLTLTAASEVIYYANSFNLEHRLQSEDRAHRIGQQRSVSYVDLYSPGTIDVKVLKSLKDKKDLASMIMGDKSIVKDLL